VPDPPGACRIETPSASSMDLASPSVRQLSPWTSLLIRLSWASPAFPPSSVLPQCVHSRSVLPPSFGVPAPPAAHRVPPAWILTTSTVCSALGSGHVASRCGKGSLRFPALPSSRLLRGPESPRSSRIERPAKSRRVVTTVPRNAVRTLRSIPLASSRTASLRPLPPCRCRPPHSKSRTEVRPCVRIVAPTPR
jgi:hypothetical protein